ncbi:MAG: PAS domain S-box protein, partial [Candidatus Desulfatibia sp.]|uniref:PAS domain S-box protein n=1 Tax=Candidatus Desulfatibia sp. TaxID=3101189 RepID=UPI002F335ED6
MNAKQESRAMSLALRLSAISLDPAGSLDDILKRAAIMIVESGEADCCSFVVADADTTKGTSGISVKRAGKKGKVEIVEGILPATFDLEDMPGLRKAIIEKTSVIQKSGEKDLSPAERKAMEDQGISLALFVPMIVGNSAIGTLNTGFEKENSRITENRLNIFSAMACGTALVYDRARLEMRLKNSEAEHRELFESSVDIMFKTDEYHMIVDINPQFTLSTGHDVSEWIGRPFGSLLTDYRSRSEINNSKACGTSFSGGEAVFKTAFGEKYFHISSWPRFDRKGNVIGNWHVAHDITDQKKKEKELIATKEKAEKASRAKSTFMANISHELRTPLTSIIGFGNLIMGNQKIPETVKAQSRIV